MFTETSNGASAHDRRIMQSMIRVINVTSTSITDSGTPGTLMHITEIINRILSASSGVPGLSHQRESFHQENVHELDDSVIK